MNSKPLVTSQRESNGQFALRLESAAAVQRDLQRSAERREREAQVIAENAEWCKAMGFDPSEAAGLFL
jgi:hypothetical protein